MQFRSIDMTSRPCQRAARWAQSSTGAASEALCAAQPGSAPTLQARRQALHAGAPRACDRSRAAEAERRPTWSSAPEPSKRQHRHAAVATSSVNGATDEQAKAAQACFKRCAIE